ncbi:hypothetical protein MPTK1_2g16710 [Marchantia polymorpha subsp. ruderalis]|uniref:Uncharacterized protein n=1 Tax=Marchantia polymorpha TaxID=3197 RepID=A0A2R6WCL0_MARPO|nr:hypothetical protein MARPO_0109s0012 [Marchantia polymorpha]BBN02621.1 hypothetical protein Mp_2g16710 [Marchantia polymorpha subsp. ruderalis]|eukprot:PTQ31579.1 hypothetical protein MARPO_0109s0012 [Marchantia polymorpha]
MVVSVSKVMANSKARDTLFQAKHEVEYDLKVVCRDANSVVDSVQCKFCRFYGREQVPGAKRKRIHNIKLFAPPYQTDNYQLHHKEVRKDKWIEYKAISFEDKKVFFNKRQEFKDTLFYFFDDTSSTLIFIISASIVKVLIGELVFNSEDEMILAEIVLQLLWRQEYGSYNVTIKIIGISLRFSTRHPDCRSGRPPPSFNNTKISSRT